MSAVPELKATLTLPKTEFPMKANLPQNEPIRLERWAALDIYGQLRKAAVGRPSFLLHDGPPYANGPLHLGHALNKGLKDFVVKSKTMAGYDSPYVPGFDCHGLPIEIKVDEQLGRKKLEMPAPAVLEACRAYAQKYIDLQTSQFERLGVFGRWRDPYKTMSRDYEARTLEVFYGFLEKGFVYRGLKPVYWCIHDRTALADAEIEYEEHTSPSVYVRYRLTSSLDSLGEEAAAALAGREVYTIIWTTTPWTLPASLAVAFHPNFEYVALAAGQQPNAPVYIVASALAAHVATACKLGEPTVLARFPGDRLDRATFQHPFLDRTILGVNADYVTADQGTGAVHTAPSHGADDFYTGVRYGLDPTTRVDASGVIHLDTSVWHEADLPAFDGKKVFAANPLIIELLSQRGALMGSQQITHSYPHCWRCHRPVIFRATEQWFIGLDTPVLRADGSDTTFRQLAIEEIARVKWDPAWGQERITNMIATRPDWCISRQRIWGVPIAVFLCTQCHAPIEDPALNARIVKLFEEQGAEAWHTTAVSDLLAPGTVCAKCNGTDFRKEMDILDVWFDSGSSWHAVAETDPELRQAYNQPDRTVLYLEGGDQHRGWFHSSLLASVALRGRAPYSNVATAGWTLDELGRAMSKSLGNGVNPVKVANEMGGEIVRLWVASIDFREDMAASDNLMKRCADIYRKLRNTFRFLLGNLDGFIPAKHEVAFADLEPLDKYMLAKTRQLTEQILDWYERFEFHRIYHAVNEFAIADLSAFYLDVLKDRMYTFAPSSQPRRSAQTVLWKITEALTRLLAPILSFTADEVWDYLPKQTPSATAAESVLERHDLGPANAEDALKGHDLSRADTSEQQNGALAPEVKDREASVHLALFPKPDAIYPEDPTKLLEMWKPIFQIRESVFTALERERKQGNIGKGLEAKVLLHATPEDLELLSSLPKSALEEFFNVSLVELHPCSTTLAPEVVKASLTSQKCERCWRYYPEGVSSYGLWENVCTRCREALTAMGIEPPTTAEARA